MPQDNLHMTVLEITHSLTKPEITTLVERLEPVIETVTDYSLDHRARLIKPMISYDSSAVALSFVPAAGEGAVLSADSYTYHHLRQDIFDICSATGCQIASRYTVPSAHLTICRFVTEKEFTRHTSAEVAPDHIQVAAFVQTIDRINEWLQETYWPREDRVIPEAGRWIVGQEKGLDMCRGTLWYGDCERIHLGRGF